MLKIINQEYESSINYLLNYLSRLRNSILILKTPRKSLNKEGRFLENFDKVFEEFSLLCRDFSGLILSISVLLFLRASH